jgi:hypothetical protein
MGCGSSISFEGQLRTEERVLGAGNGGPKGLAESPAGCPADSCLSDLWARANFDCTNDQIIFIARHPTSTVSTMYVPLLWQDSQSPT